ncbi:MAG: serine/threonine protein kinase, partial [Deltaproteobacteria bacterium]|nr:serine/threonine protein kinase [Deltaproteobacteria bacterium]
MSTHNTSAWGEEETKFFFALTPDKIFSAVERLGLRCTGRIFQLNSMENRVYEVEVLHPDSPDQMLSYIAKFYRPGRWSHEQILDEHRFLLDLEEYDLPVISPFRTAENKTLAVLDDVAISYALFPKARGRTPDELNDEQLARLGRLLARVHNVGAIREAPSRIELNPQTYAISNLDYLLSNDIIPGDLAPSYETVVIQICDLIEPMFEGVKFQRIHGDCHLGNILWGNDGPFLVDFDDMVRGPCVQDLWLMLQGNDERALRS